MVDIPNYVFDVGISYLLVLGGRELERWCRVRVREMQ